MIEYENQATRKGLESDKAAVCPHFGCVTLKRLKPLKLGILGFKKYPICKEHKIPLVFVEEFIGDFLESVHACLFDKSIAPPKELLKLIKNKYPEHLSSVYHKWMFCSSIGRGAKIVPAYMNSLSRAYINSLNKRQKKSIKDNSYIKKRDKLILLGLKKIELEYVDFLKKLYDTNENLYNREKIKSLPQRVKYLIQDWLNNFLKTINLKSFCSNEIKEQHSIKMKKTIYDKILCARTCMLLLGRTLSEFSLEISAFELFAAYREFLDRGLCFEYDSSKDILSSGDIKPSKNMYSQEVFVSKKQDLFDDKNNKLKECGRCHQILSYSQFFKVSKHSDDVRPYCKNCHSELGLIHTYRKKLEIIIGHFNGKCAFCDNDFILLPALQFHHPNPEIKTKSWRKIKGKSKEFIIKQFENDMVILLCANCHLKEQADVFYEYKEHILQNNLFSLETKIINKKLFEKTSHIPKKLDRMHTRQKIREWMKKRFIIEQIYKGRCIGCEEVTIFNDLPSLEFHHKIEIDNDVKYKWKDLENLKSKDIMHLLIEQNCICLCSNCHLLVHSRFNEFAEEIMKDIFNSKKISYYSEIIKQKSEKIQKNIQKYNINQNAINFCNPLTLEMPHTENWKTHFSKIHDYLKKKEKELFSAYELVDVLGITPRHIYKYLNRFIDRGYIAKDERRRGRFFFTEKGFDLIIEIKKLYPDII
jgi:predicted transcriptional regulator/5-methylcytosine-specific restriction endonuclease McrA